LIQADDPLHRAVAVRRDVDLVRPPALRFLVPALAVRRDVPRRVSGAVEDERIQTAVAVEVDRHGG
jgi:hypothetical protein